MHLTQWMRHATLSRPYICGCFFHLFRAKDGIVVEMTPKPFHPQITMVSDSHMWTENKVTGIINAFERDALESTFE